MSYHGMSSGPRGYTRYRYFTNRKANWKKPRKIRITPFVEVDWTSPYYKKPQNLYNSKLGRSIVREMNVELLSSGLSFVQQPVRLKDKVTAETVHNLLAAVIFQDVKYVMTTCVKENLDYAMDMIPRNTGQLRNDVRDVIVKSIENVRNSADFPMSVNLGTTIPYGRTVHGWDDGKDARIVHPRDGWYHYTGYPYYVYNEDPHAKYHFFTEVKYFLGTEMIDNIDSHVNDSTIQDVGGMTVLVNAEIKTKFFRWGLDYTETPKTWRAMPT